MSTRRVVLCVAAAMWMGAAVRSQSVDDFDAWMRTIDEKNQSVQQSIARRDPKGAGDDARVLRATFALVETFWAKRGDGADAVALAKEGQDRAADVQKAADDSDFDRAAAAAIKVAETCTPCHRVHRPLP